jgi:hypothetical protein
MIVAEIQKNVIRSDILHFCVQIEELTPVHLRVEVVQATGLGLDLEDGKASLSLSKLFVRCTAVERSGLATQRHFETSSVPDAMVTQQFNYTDDMHLSLAQGLQFQVVRSDPDAGEIVLGSATLEQHSLVDEYEGELQLQNGTTDCGSLLVRVHHQATVEVEPLSPVGGIEGAVSHSDTESSPTGGRKHSWTKKKSTTHNDVKS